MKVETVIHQAGSVTARSALIYDEAVRGTRPLLLVSANWLGMSDASIERVKRMAGSKYVALLADMYGDGKVSDGPPEAATLANGLRADGTERRKRINAALDALVRESGKRGIGDAGRQAAVGFCFGGGNVLELARTGPDLRVVICVHGDLTTNAPAAKGSVKGTVLVIHGAADPIEPKANRDAFENEMTAAGVKWQMLTFAHLLHSFSEEEADVPGIAKFDPAAARQTYRLIDETLAAAFDDTL